MIKFSGFESKDHAVYNTCSLFLFLHNAACKRILIYSSHIVHIVHGVRAIHTAHKKLALRTCSEQNSASFNQKSTGHLGLTIFLSKHCMANRMSSEQTQGQGISAFQDCSACCNNPKLSKATSTPRQHAAIAHHDSAPRQRSTTPGTHLSVKVRYPAVMALLVLTQYPKRHKRAMAQITRIRLLLNRNMDVLVHFQRGQHVKGFPADVARKRSGALPKRLSRR